MTNWIVEFKGAVRVEAETAKGATAAALQGIYSKNVGGFDIETSDPKEA